MNNLTETTANEVNVAGIDIRGYVFVVPLDAPLPSEVAAVIPPTGGLLARLAPLAGEENELFSFVALSGAELLAIERAFRLMQTVKRVAVLTDLPGARYDVLFTQAARQIGLPKIEWPQISESLASRVVEMQRLKDTKPWSGNPDLAPGHGADRPDDTRPPKHGRTIGAAVIEVPEDFEEDDGFQPS